MNFNRSDIGIVGRVATYLSVVLIYTLTSFRCAAQSSHTPIDSLRERLRNLERQRSKLDSEIAETLIWIRKLAETEPAPQGKKKMICKTSPTYLMSAPNYNSEIIATLSGGTTVIVDSKSFGDYVLVEYGDSKGYIYGVMLQNINATGSESPRSSMYSEPTSPPKRNSSRTYYRGPKGGCYYINSSGNKQYVDRSLCN